MKKKLFFGMLAAVGMLFAAACSQEELTTVQSADEATVSFTIGLEGGVQTRAISDGSTANLLVYDLFNEDGTPVASFERVATETSFPTTVTLSLAKGQTYRVAFWAQNKDCTAYGTDDLTAVTVSYESAVNNDETRDAFFAATEAFTVTGSTGKDITLKRPFAQINVGVSDKDWSGATSSGVTIVTSKVVIDDAATQINLLTGAVDGSEVVTYDFADIPNDPATISATVDGVEQSYKWLSMSYILVNDGSVETPSTDGASKTTLASLAYTFHPEDETKEDISVTEGLTSVPVQRNYRTNILGQLLTGDVTFNVKIDPIYEDDYIYPDSVVEELKMVAAYGGSITLEEDVTLESTLYIAKGVSVELNLNGKTITPPSETDRTIIVQDGATLVINGDGLIRGDLDTDDFCIGVKGGTLIINGGTFIGDVEGCIYLFNVLKSIYAEENIENYGSIEINGGYFSVTGTPTYNTDWYYVVNVQNGENGVANPGTISIKGGVFENYDPSWGDDTGTPSTFVADGYKSVQVSTEPSPYGTFMVVADKVNVETADGLTAAIADEYISEITLDADVTIAEATTISGEKTINLNGNSLDVDKIEVEAGSVVKITDGELNSTLRSGDAAEIVIDGVTLTSSESSPGIELGSTSTLAGGCKLTVSNSTIDVSGNASGTGIIIEGANEVAIDNTTIKHSYFGITQNGSAAGSTITLNDVTIDGKYHGVYLSTHADGSSPANTLTIKGGSIHSEEASPIEVKKTTLTVNGATLSSNAADQGYYYYDGACSSGYGIVLAGHANGTAYDIENCPCTLTNVTYSLPNVVAATDQELMNAGYYNGYEKTGSNSATAAISSLTKIE